MELKELYASKGELQTTIEITQAKLRQVNEQLIKHLSNGHEGSKAPDNKTNSKIAQK